MSVPVPWITSFDPKTSQKGFFVFNTKSFNPNLETQNQPRVVNSCIIPLFESRQNALTFDDKCLKYLNTNNIILDSLENNTHNTIKCVKDHVTPYVDIHEAVLVDLEEQNVLQLALYNNVKFFTLPTVTWTI